MARHPGCSPVRSASQRSARSLVALALVFLWTSAIPAAEVVDKTLGLTPPAPLPIAASPPVPAGQTVILDDFNRADGPLGADWTDRAGSGEVQNNAAILGSLAISTFNGGSGDTVEGDVETSGTALQYTGFVLNYGTGQENLFLKVQNQDSDSMFEAAACYLGNNGDGGDFGLGFFTMDEPFQTAHMRVSVDAARTVTIEFSDIDGGGDSQVYVCDGAPPAEGHGIGMVGFASLARMDNFAGEQDCRLGLTLERSSVRPGDDLQITVDLEHHRLDPATVPFVLSIIDREGVVVFSRASAPRTFEHGDSFHHVLNVGVPAELAPGRYELTLSLDEMTQGVVQESIPFEVIAPSP